MDSELLKAKNTLREVVRTHMKASAPHALLSASQRLCDQLRQQLIWTEAQSVLFFAPLASEPNLWPLLIEALAEDKTVCLPRYISAGDEYVACQVCDIHRDLVCGKFRIREPAPDCPVVPLNRLDLALVPGIAFDARGGRLGRGKGFYDRLLVNVRGLKCGVAFEEQMVDTVPTGPLDIRLNCILTPTRWIET